MVAVGVGCKRLLVCVELGLDAARGLGSAIELQVEGDLTVREQVAAVPVGVHSGTRAVLGLLLAEPAVQTLLASCEALPKRTFSRCQGQSRRRAREAIIRAVTSWPKREQVDPADLIGAGEILKLVGWKTRKSLLDSEDPRLPTAGRRRPRRATLAQGGRRGLGGAAALIQM